MAKTIKSYQEELKKLKQKYQMLRQDYLIMLNDNKKSQNLIRSYRNVFRDMVETDLITEFIDIESDEGQQMVADEKGKKFDTVYIH